MALKIRLHEASPRKFRQDPSTRGVGGKYGPLGEDPLVAAKRKRSTSTQSWIDNGTADPAFKPVFMAELSKQGLGMFNTDPYSFETSPSVDVFAKPEDLFGFYITGDFKDYSGSKLDWDSPDAKGFAGLLAKIATTITETPERAGMSTPVPVSCGFVVDNEGKKISDIWLKPSYSILEDELSVYSRHTVADEMVDAIGEATAYLKKMAPAIKREMERTYNK